MDTDLDIVAGRIQSSTFGIGVASSAVDRISQDRLRDRNDRSLAQQYPKYYKALPKNMTEIDVYGVHMLFNIQDPSGAIQHASKKLLLSGVRTGGKTARQDIQEARDTLNRWLQLNPEVDAPSVPNRNQPSAS